MILESSDASPAVARAFCDDVLAETACDAAVVGDARLAVSELVTNAVVHAHTAIELNVFVRDDALRIEVTDFGVDRPHVWAHDATRGHGLPIIEALARSWGVLDLGSGKTVWCELPLARAPAYQPASPRSAR